MKHNQLDLFGGETAVKTVDMSYTNVPHYSVSLVREKTSKLAAMERITSPDDVHNRLEGIFNLASKPQEHFVMLALNTKNEIIGAFTIHIGTVNSSIVHPRDVFQRALLANATSIVVAHNHPSGNTEPSSEDIEVTKRLVKAGELMGIHLIDHLIIGDGRYLSLQEKGYM